MFIKVFFTHILILLPFVFSSSALSSPVRSTPEEISLFIENEIRTKILMEYVQWEGVKYRLGGTSKNGIDCSSLMQEMFNNAFGDVLNAPLPRTTSAQIKHGSKTFRKDLRPGDLIFFHITNVERHVGVYIGDDRFIHASTSKGVKISSLQSQYWTEKYTTARRVLL
ncbi:C40 family peptidase [Enterobacter cloacae]|nr:C40 family peptidase [Enterobacter cloacae]